jgi:CHAT domain-containing protein
VGHGRSQLVVLSACSTSRGSAGFFDDDDSMVRRLMEAGVPDVVASRWMVDSSSTALLMKSFYSQLLNEKPVAESLASAMQTLRAQPEFSHPYYWAGFSVFGRS